MAREADSQEAASLATRGITPDAFRTRSDDRNKLTPDTRQLSRQLARRSARSGQLSPLSYNLTISHGHRFVWFRVAKAATRSILGHFAEHDVPIEVDHAMRLRYPTALFGDYFKFAFVRHPLDRFMSAWRDKIVDYNYSRFDEATLPKMQRIENFAKWTAQHDLSDLTEADQHLALQSRLIDLTQIDYLGRLESFDDDFAAICKEIGLPAAPVTPLNQTRAPAQGRPRASTELASIVADIYRRDFQIFGY